MYARYKMPANLRKSRPIQTKKPAYESGLFSAAKNCEKLF